MYSLPRNHKRDYEMSTSIRVPRGLFFKLEDYLYFSKFIIIFLCFFYSNSNLLPLKINFT